MEPRTERKASKKGIADALSLSQCGGKAAAKRAESGLALASPSERKDSRRARLLKTPF
jgi:hypothetical protein